MENNSNLSFRGAFLLNFNKTFPGTREAFEHSMGKVKGQIFENFRGKEGDTLYVLRNSKDYYAANFIKTNKLKFCYMPELDSKLQFSTHEPESIIDYIDKTKLFVIRKTSKLMDYIKANREKCKSVDNSQNPCDGLLKNLRIEFSGKKVKNSKGIQILKDKNSDGYIALSPQSANEIHFAYVNPGNQHEYPSRYAIDKQGNILAKYKTPDEMLAFKKSFAAAVKHHLHQD